MPRVGSSGRYPWPAAGDSGWTSAGAGTGSPATAVTVFTHSGDETDEDDSDDGGDLNGRWVGGW